MSTDARRLWNCVNCGLRWTPVHKLFLKERGRGKCVSAEHKQGEPTKRPDFLFCSLRVSCESLQDQKVLKHWSCKILRDPSRFHPLRRQIFAECLQYQALFEEMGLQYQGLVYSSNFMAFMK